MVATNPRFPAPPNPFKKSLPQAPHTTDVNELVRATGQTRQAIQARAKREGWPYLTAPQPFGPDKHLYSIDQLPERLRWLVGYFRRYPVSLLREGHAEYERLLSLRGQIAKTNATIARLTVARQQIAAELAAAGLSQ